MNWIKLNYVPHQVMNLQNCDFFKWMHVTALLMYHNNGDLFQAGNEKHHSTQNLDFFLTGISKSKCILPFPTKSHYYEKSMKKKNWNYELSPQWLPMNVCFLRLWRLHDIRYVWYVLLYSITYEYKLIIARKPFITHKIHTRNLFTAILVGAGSKHIKHACLFLLVDVSSVVYPFFFCSSHVTLSVVLLRWQDKWERGKLSKIFFKSADLTLAETSWVHETVGTIFSFPFWLTHFVSIYFSKARKRVLPARSLLRREWERETRVMHHGSKHLS